MEVMNSPRRVCRSEKEVCAAQKGRAGAFLSSQMAKPARGAWAPAEMRSAAAPLLARGSRGLSSPKQSEGHATEQHITDALPLVFLSSHAVPQPRPSPLAWRGSSLLAASQGIPGLLCVVIKKKIFLKLLLDVAP